VAERLLQRDWPASAVVFVGPHGAGRTTLLDAIAGALQLGGTACVSGDVAAGASAPPDGVAVVDGGAAVETAKAVLALVRDNWRVLACVDGPGRAVDDAFAALARAGHARLVGIPALERPVREAILRRELPGADARVVDLLARSAPGDGVALAVLAARTTARAVLNGGGVDVDAAAVALRRGKGLRGDAPPVPVRVDELVTCGTAMPAGLASTMADCVRPLAALGPLGPAIAAVGAGAPLAVAGGRGIGVAHRAVLHHALAGRSVLLVTACQTELPAANQLAELVDRDAVATGVGASVVARLPIAVLADAARSMRDLPKVVPCVRPFVGFDPEVVVVESRSLDDLDRVAAMDRPFVVVADGGALLPSGGWDVDDGDPQVAVRRSGEPWVRVVAPRGDGAEGHGLATDETGALRAWRLWALVIDADGVALGSPVRSTVWPRGVITSGCARCGSNPTATCSCGIYAFSDASHALAAWRSAPQLVFGELRCWGRILRHEDGVRAQHAQPVRLHLGTIGSEAERRTLSARYGCDVIGR
jgi:hypothetical protein